MRIDMRAVFAGFSIFDTSGDPAPRSAAVVPWTAACTVFEN